MIYDVQDLENYLKFLIEYPIIGDISQRENGINAFDNIERVFSEFHITCSSEIKICHAVYDTPSYEGYATVFYYDSSDSKFYEVHGSHCSCYGLEECWKPEEINMKALYMRIEKGGFTGMDQFLERYQYYVTTCFKNIK